MDIPAWLAWTLDILIVVVMILGLLFVQMIMNARKTAGRIMAEIWMPNGETPRKLVKLDPVGDTVTIDNKAYRLRKPKSREEEERDKETGHYYPSKRFVQYPANPLMGLRMLTSQVRIESWEYDNPEPIRPFYGRVDENGKFVESQLTVTSTEWTAQKSVIQATQIAMRVQEREAKEKEWLKAMTNLPNKMILYIMGGAAVIGIIVCIVMVYQMARA